MLVDQPDQLAEAVVQQLGELLDPARPGASQPLGKRREPGDVGEQDRRQELLGLCLGQWLMPIRKTPDDERGNIAGDLGRVAVSFMLGSSNRLLHVVPPSREHLVLVTARRRSGSWSGSLLNAICGRWFTHDVLLVDGPVANRAVLYGLSRWSSSGWVEPQSPVRALVQCLLEGLPGGVARDRGQLAGDLGLVCRRDGRLCGDAAAGEPVEAGGLKAGRLAVDPLVAPDLRLVGGHWGGPPDVAGSRQPEDQHVGAGPVVG